MRFMLGAFFAVLFYLAGTRPIHAAVTATRRKPRRKPRRAADLGIDDDLYEQLLASQDGHCALCPTRPKTRRLHVDHDHRSPDNRIRGLLCYACNRMLTTKATREWLLQAAEYVGE